MKTQKQSATRTLTIRAPKTYDVSVEVPSKDWDAVAAAENMRYKATCEAFEETLQGFIKAHAPAARTKTERSAIGVQLTAEDIECLCSFLSGELNSVMPDSKDYGDDAEILAAWREHSPHFRQGRDMPREFYDHEADLLEKLLAALSQMEVAHV